VVEEKKIIKGTGKCIKGQADLKGSKGKSPLPEGTSHSIPRTKPKAM